MPANLENSAVATGLEKVSFYSNPKERQCQRMLKLPHVAPISHTSKVMLKILQARLQQYVNRELPNVQDGFRKCRGTRDQVCNICWIIKKAESSRKKTFTSTLLTMPKPMTLDFDKLWKILQDMGTIDDLTCLTNLFNAF